MRLGSILLIVGFVSLAAYAGLFYWTLAKAGRDQVARYNSTFAKQKVNLVGTALVAGAFLVPDALFAGILGLCAFAWIGRATLMQRAQMREMLFDSGFGSRLFAISLLAAVGISCLLAGKLWFQATQERAQRCSEQDAASQESLGALPFESVRIERGSSQSQNSSLFVSNGLNRPEAIVAHTQLWQPNLAESHET